PGAQHRLQQHERDHPGGVQPGDLGVQQEGEDAPAEVRPDHEDLAVREVDHEEDAVDHRVAERDEAVHRPQGQAEHELLGQDAQEIGHAQSSPRYARRMWSARRSTSAASWATMRPFWSTYPRCAIPRATVAFCSTTRMVVPWRLMVWM